MAEIFVSYTSSDRDWALWIGQELKGLGHTPHLHESEIEKGDDILAWMEQGLEAADYVLCVLSDEYLKAPYSVMERNAATWRAAGGKRPGSVLFVVVKPCTVPALIAPFRRCELFGLEEAERQTRFREFMGVRKPPEMVPRKTGFALSNVPIRVPHHFLGREDALRKIEEALARNRGRVAITALHGLRGVGKTTLAAAYAERHRGDYRATWWVRAQTDSTTRADLVGLGVRLNWIAADEKEEAALAAVMERLQHEGEGILLIYDNAIEADALQPYLPRGGQPHVLLTSNAHAWRGVATPVEIRLWPKEIGADYLIARTGREEERDAAALSDTLGGLPLAHEQAAAYCEDLGIGFAEYQRRFEAATGEFLDDKAYAPAEYHPEHAAEHGDRLTVAGTFRLAIQAAAKRHPAAQLLIVHAALLAPEPIPLFLFRDAREKFAEPFASTLVGDGLDRAVAALRSFALIDREIIVDERDPTITTDCIRLHRLVRQVANMGAEGAGEEIARVLVEAIAKVFPRDVFGNPASWPRARRLDAIASYSLEASDFDQIEREARSLLNRLASYRQSALGAYEQAQQLFERSLAISNRIFGPEHPDTATSLNNLAVLLLTQHKFAEARPYLEQALAITERAFGREDQNTVTALNNLAATLQELGDLKEARKLHERALGISESFLGGEHPETGRALNALASNLHATGETAEARPLFERSLAVHEKARGEEHPDTATVLVNLGILLRDEGDLPAARRYFERALAIYEKVLGRKHPSTIDALKSLAATLEQLGEPRALRALKSAWKQKNSLPVSPLK
ncbi:MAG: hypothetical protein QOG66_214 [Methylobacteriaceae bacterium]|nr:hypothetical protein [Methylobacteriaceae bacterium]